MVFEFQATTILESVYLFSVSLVAFAMMYPALKDACEELTGSENSGAALSVLIFLTGIGLSYNFIFPLVTWFLFLMSILISSISGLELIYRSKGFKLNIALFMFSTFLSAISLVAPELNNTIYIINGGIYLTGMYQGVTTHIEEVSRNLVDEKSYPKILSILIMLLSILTIYLPLFGLEMPNHLQEMQFFSDLGFIISGVIPAIWWLSKK